MRKRLLWISVMSLILGLLNINAIEVSAGLYPAIYIDPATTEDPELTVGQNYTISIKTDYNGSDIWGYEFTLTYNRLILNGIEVVNGDLITEDVGTIMWKPGTFDNSAGKLSLTGCAFFSTPPTLPPTTSGPGTLVNITFRVVGTGNSNMTLGPDTRLIGIDGVNIIHAVRDPKHIQHGFFDNSAIPVTHDIGVKSVEPSSTEVAVDELVNITVVVENQGTVNEDVTVKVYRKTGGEFWPIGTKIMENLTVGASKTLIFSWSAQPRGEHTIKAEVVELSGETDTEDNAFESTEIVRVTAIVGEPIPVQLIIIIVAVIVMVIAVAMYALRRRKK